MNSFIGYSARTLSRQINDIYNCDGRILDLFFINDKLFVDGIKHDPLPITPEDNYHPALFDTLMFCEPDERRPIANRPSNESTNTLPCHRLYNFRDGDHRGFYEPCPADWTSATESLEINDAVEQFYNILYDVIDCHYPIRKSPDDSNRYKHPV